MPGPGDQRKPGSKELVEKWPSSGRAGLLGSVRQQLSIQLFTGVPIWGCSDTPGWGDTHSLASVRRVETGRMCLSLEEGRGRLPTDLGTEHRAFEWGEAGMVERTEAERRHAEEFWT